MGDTGLEPKNVTGNDDTGLRNQHETGAAYALHFRHEEAEFDADLARLFDTWPVLDDETKRAILALAERAAADAD